MFFCFLVFSCWFFFFFFFKQKTAYEMRISDWSSDVCSSDLLGRAPGSDQRVAMALRRNLQSDPNQFPRDVMELQAYFAGNPELGITAVPGAGADVDLWILGSSLFGAHMAALMRLPSAFASNFAPKALDEAIALYRQAFRPSEYPHKHQCLPGYNDIAANN